MSVKRWKILLGDLRDAAGTDGATTFANGELLGLLHGDGRDELDVDGNVVAGTEIVANEILEDHAHAAAQRVETVLAQQRSNAAGEPAPCGGSARRQHQC